MGSKPSRRIASSHASEPVFLIWVKLHCSLYSPVSLNILREVTDYLPGLHELLVVYQDIVLLGFNCQSKQFRSLGRFDQFSWTNDRGGYARVDNNRAVRCGGWGKQGDMRAPSYTYLVDLKAKTASRLANMKIDRENSPGVVCFQSKIYVFGGVAPFLSSKKTKSGEFLSHLDGKWRYLKGEMSASRSCFSPCAYQSRIYLCSAESSTVDICSNDCISLISLQLPSESHITIVFQGQLLFISSNFTTDLTGNRRKHRREVVFDMQTKVSAKVWGSEVYFADYNAVRWVKLGANGEVLTCSSRRIIDISSN